MGDGGWKSNGITEAGGRWFGGEEREISFYGRVTNLRTRHCRVPADARTMRLRNTMLHSGNLKAVLTTNLQPLPPPCALLDSSPLSLPFPICVYQYSLLPHIPPLDCRPRHSAASGPCRYFLILSSLPFLPPPF